MMSMRAILIITAKDLRQRVRDGTVLVFALLLPLGLAFLFNLIMGGGESGFSARYAVADADGGPLATAFTEQVLGPITRDMAVQVQAVASAEEGRRLTEQGEVHATFVIPAGFSADVTAGRPATLRVIGSVDAPVAVQVARELAQAYATDLGAIRLAVAVAHSGDPAADPEQLAAQAAQRPAPVAVLPDTSAAHRELDSITFYAAGMAVFFLFFTAMFSVGSVLAERGEGTMGRLLAAPVSRPAILAGKLLSGVLVGVVAMAVLVTASSLLLGASWGHPAGVAALVVAAVLAAVGIMAVVATFARTTEQAANWQSMLAVLLGLFGGAFFPAAQLGALATVSYLTPHQWFLRGLADLGGGDLGVVVVPVLVLLAFAVVCFGMAATRVGKVIRP